MMKDGNDVYSAEGECREDNRGMPGREAHLRIGQHKRVSDFALGEIGNAVSHSKVVVEDKVSAQPSVVIASIVAQRKEVGAWPSDKGLDEISR